MCGIAGNVNFKGRPSPSLVKAMIHSLAHRGPDDEGVWAEGPVVLGHRRLSIIDLSEAGHQPMHFPERGLSIVYNGEVYNFRVLRAELVQLGYNFKSHTDTEVILKGYDAWGDSLFAKLRGMFAFALWDERAQELVLARDPFGIKPVYYGTLGEDFIFASELKAIRLHPRFSTEIHVDSLAYYLSHAYVPEPRSIFRSVHRVPSGCVLRVKQSGEHQLTRYYTLPSLRPVKRTMTEKNIELLTVLEDSVKAHLVSDVPVGVFLSGGMDSSAIVTLMRRAGVQNIKTFSIGYDRENYDERPFARQIAQRFQTDHYEILIQPDIATYIRDRLLDTYDEPFGNAAALIADVLSGFTREHVKVALSGLGGDELFGGYGRYIGMLWSEKIAVLPSCLINSALGVLQAMPRSPDRRDFFERARRYLQFSKIPLSSRYDHATSFLPHDFKGSLLAPELLSEQGDNAFLPTIREGVDLLEGLMEVDLTTYMVGDLLTYSDRASMRHGLEVRVPFCDIEVARFARTLLPSDKIRRGQLKFILRSALGALIPPEVLSRPKQGFAMPIGEWLKDSLWPLVEEFMSTRALKSERHLNPDAVARVVSDFKNGHHQNGFLLWNLLIFRIWQSKYL
jgi:asparagine synthase (glutamine-hydrolysing)